MTDVPMIPTVINGRWTLDLPEHRAARAEWQTGWETERLASMAANLHPGAVVVDVGSEEGDLPALFASWVAGPAYRVQRDAYSHPAAAGRVVPSNGGVILVEPNERVWPNMRVIFEANDLAPPLACYVGFAGDEPRVHADVIRHGWPACADGPVIGDHGFCNLWERPDLGAIQLDALVDVEVGCDAITIDTEGSELAVLHGAERTLTTFKPLVWVSVHPQFSVDMYDVTRDDLLRFMQSLGYRCEWLATDHEEHWLFWHTDRDAPKDWRDG